MDINPEGDKIGRPWWYKNDKQRVKKMKCAQERACSSQHWTNFFHCFVSPRAFLVGPSTRAPIQKAGEPIFLNEARWPMSMNLRCHCL